MTNKISLETFSVHQMIDGQNFHFAFKVEGDDINLDINKIILAVGTAFEKAIEGKGKDSDNRKTKPRGATAAQAEAPAEVDSKSTRRRRKATSDDSVADANTEDNAKPAGDDSSVAEPAKKPARRRRGKQDGDASDAGTGEGDKGKSAANPRRRRRSNGDDKGSGSKAGDAGDADTGDASADDTVSDADLTSTASRAAAKITPKKVNEIIEEFGVSDIKELTQEQRVEFVARMEAEAG